MKQLVKRAVLAAAPSIAPMLWRTRRSSLLVLMYHRVLPRQHVARQSEQPGMYISPQDLALHLDLLRRHFTLVHLDDWLDLAISGAPLPPRACAITFDDGWRDNYDYAFEVLKQAQAPATIYLVSDLVGTHYSFWPNDLARILAADDRSAIRAMPEWLQQLVNGLSNETSGPSDVFRIDAIISACKNSRSDAEMLNALAQLKGSVPAPAERDLMSWDEIRQMSASGLVRFGSHTRRHTRLSRVAGRDELRDEILASRGVIADQLGAVPRTFCYPNGDVSAAALELARSAYIGAVTTQQGWHSAADDRYLIRRVGVHESISAPGAFLARIGGWI